MNTTKPDDIKAELLKLIDFTLEVDELLGPGNGNARHCWNKAVHEDVTPSLSFSPEHGGWKCHACGEKGDIFSLYMKVREASYPETLKYYLKKYDLWRKITDIHIDTAIVGRKSYTPIEDETVRSRFMETLGNWIVKKEAVQFMFDRYGINWETIKKYKLGYGSDVRVWIPVFTGRASKKDVRSGNIPQLMNIRKHDCFRRWCWWYNEKTKEWIKQGRPKGIGQVEITNQSYGDWSPKWDDKAGKILSIRGHGSPYIYPATVLLESTDLYVVGGELKALLLLQLGINAVTFTCGEGSYARDLLPYFIGKHVRVLFDADPNAHIVAMKDLPVEERAFCTMIGREGLSQAERATYTISQVLANNGADVEAVIWPEAIKKLMPDKGDVTDLLRLSGWDIAALGYLEVFPIERTDSGEPEAIGNIKKTEGIPKWNNVPKAEFGRLVTPEAVNTWMRVRAIVSGRGDVPFVVPKCISFHCKAGEADIHPKCTHCILPRLGFKSSISYDTSTQISMCGKSEEQILKEAYNSLGISKGCQSPEIKIDPVAVELTVCTPPVDGNEAKYEYAHRQVYLMGEEKIEVIENTSYEIMGKVISDPRKGTFTFVSTEWRPVEDDVLTYKKRPEFHGPLTEATASVENIVADFRDNIVSQIYGQDDMIEALVLTYFMPFIFSLGSHIQERVCPTAMVIGDTTVGKSTSSNKIMRHYSAGFPHSAAADPTHAGLIGGNIQVGNRMSFSWGVFPVAHKMLVLLDEYNKLSLETIGKMTNMLSSGVAERTTVSGPRKTKAWIRLVALCNPRGERSLASYSDPLYAALQVAGSVQDLGRFDFVFVQHQLPKHRLTEAMRIGLGSKVPHLYTKELARYHLQWAWSLNQDSIKFQNSDGVFRRAADLSDRFGNSPVLLPAQARFKLARIAAAYAALLFSHDDNMNLIVTEEHVEIAYNFFERIYGKYISQGSTESGVMVMPSKLIAMLNKVKDQKKLRFLAISDSWSREDIHGTFGSVNGNMFIELCQFEHGLITRKYDRYHPKNDSAFRDMIESYINERDQQDTEAANG